ncbi:MAG: prepilin-type N-terminal cleavage/methylation domain-containing protein [Acidobacteriota bacterium]
MATQLIADRERRSESGFSLAELSVALAIVSMLFLAALSMLALDQKIYAKQDQALEAVREGRHALESMERDLLMLGYQVDTQTTADLGADGTLNTNDDILGQAQIVYAAPFDFTFNADISQQNDAIQDGSANDTTPNGYAPVTFYTGAETVRFSLDSNDDGTVNASDHGDEPEEAVSPNPGLYALNREVYSSVGGTNSKESGPVALVRGPVAYPSGAKAVPLFQYWGYFDADSALDLWGDTGAGGGISGNGVLEAGEINALGPVVDEDLDNDNTIDSGEDKNGDGVLQRRITDLIKKVDVHVTTESTVIDQDYYDAVRSSSANKFRFRVATISTQVKPRNIDLPGGSCRDKPEPSSSVTVANACPDPLADGIVDVNWALSSDDGGGEQDVAKYILFRTDQDNLFSPTPYDEVEAGIATWQDNQINMRTWPPVQYWYKARAMDCTPALSDGDPVGGAYPPLVGAHYPANIKLLDVPGDSGDQIDVQFDRSPDDPGNSTGYGGAVTDYHVYRSINEDYRCVPPANKTAISADGSDVYTYRDNATNSTSGPTYGPLFYYWMRTKDDQESMSPYSPRYCGRAYLGPTFPLDQHARGTYWNGSDHPIEVYFSTNPANEAAGYPRQATAYNIYRSHDIDGDGTRDSLVDDSAGYTASDLAGTAYYQGLVWTVGRNGLADVKQSTDGGYAWRDVGDISSDDLNAISFGSRLDGVAVGAAGVVLFTDDGGLVWNAPPSGTVAELHDVAHFDAQTVIAVGNAGTILRSTNAGQSWVSISSGVGDDLDGVAIVGDTVFVTGDSGAALRSTDRGLTFTPMVFTTDTMRGVCAVKEGGGSVTVWAGGQDQVFKSIDGGDTWTAIAMGAGKMSVACAPAGRVVVVAPDADKIYTSTDGATFATAGVATYQPIDAAFLDESIAFVVDRAGQLHRWNADNTWTNTTVDALMQLTGVALRPEIVWEDSTTRTAASGTPYYYVVTASYYASSALDGECGVLPDRSSTVEIPDDNVPQILVDSCNNFELAVRMP